MIFGNEPGLTEINTTHTQKMYDTFSTIEDVRRVAAEVPANPGADKAHRVSWMFAVLDAFAYARRTREEKGLIREFLQESTGYSRAQVARYITTHQKSAHAPLAFAPVAATPAPAVEPAAVAASEPEAHAAPTMHGRYASRVVLGAALAFLVAVIGSHQQPRAALTMVHRPARHVVADAKPRVTLVSTYIADPRGGSIAAPLIAFDDAVALPGSAAVDITEGTVVAAGPAAPSVEESSTTVAFAPLQGVAARRAARLNRLEQLHDAADVLKGDLYAFGPGHDGQVLMMENGRMVWRDILPTIVREMREGTSNNDALHGSGDDDANAAYDSIVRGVGRKPGARSTEQTGGGRGGYGGAGGNQSTTTTIINTVSSGGTGDLTQSEADGLYWALLGNTGTDADVNFLGTTDNEDLVLRTNNVEAVRILTNGNTGIGTSTPGSPLAVSGSAIIGRDIGAAAADTGVTLEVIGTASGKNLFATESVSGSHLYAALTFGGAGLTDCDTGATSKLLWSANTKTFLCGVDQGGVGASYVAGQGLSLSVANVFTLNATISGSLVRFNTLSGSVVYAKTSLLSSGSLVVDGNASIDDNTLFVNSSTNRVGIGTTAPKTALEVIGTVSGSNIFATQSVSGAHLYAAVTFGGAGLTDCDNSTTSKLLWSADTKQFSCGSDQNTTYTAGQGLSLNGTTFSLSSSFSGSSLEIYGTASGRILHAQDVLRSSGSLIVDGAATFNNASFRLLDSSFANCTALETVNGVLTCGSDADTTYTAGQGLSLNATTFSLNATITGSLLKFTTVSGSTLYAKDTLATSGSLVVNSGVTFKSLVSCSTLQTSSNGALSCGPAAAFTSTGSLQTAFDRRYVNVSGDTMTGALAIRPTAGFSTIGLNVAATLSGRIIHAENIITSSGGLRIAGVMTGATALYGAGLQDCNATTGKLQWSASTGRFTCGTDTDTNTTYTAGQGLSLSAANDFTLNSTISGSLVRFTTVSGSVVFARNELRSSGSLIVRGASTLQSTLNVAGATVLSSTLNVTGDSTFDTNTLFVNSSTNRVGVGTTAPKTALEVIGTVSGSNLFATQSVSGSHLYAAVTFGGAGLTDCDTSGTSKLLWSADTKQFSCGSDANTTYTAGQGLTLTGTAFSVNSTLTGSLVRFTTVSGSTVFAKNTLVSSGSLIVKKYAGTATGNILIVDSRGLVYDATNKRVGIGTAAPEDKLHVVGGGILLDNTQAISFKNTGGSAVLALSYDSGNNLVLRNNTDASTYLGVNAAGTGDVHFQTQGQVRMTIDQDGLVGIGTTAPETALEVIGTISGSILRARTAITSSGSLRIAGAFSGATVMYGAGLQDCDATTGKLLWNAATGRFTCGTDQTGGAASSFGSGNVVTLTDRRFVNTAGDTMTGGLLIVNGGSALPSIDAGLLLEVAGTMSGRIIHAHTALTSSGTLRIAGAFSGATTIYGAGLQDCDATTGKLQWNAATGRFTCGTDQNTGTTYYAGQGLGLNSGVFTLNSTISGSLIRFTTVSGSTLYAKTALRSSGSLVVDGVTTLNGNILLGNATADLVRLRAQWSGSIIPNVSNLYDLGSDSNRWRHLYLSGSSLHVGTSGNEATIGYNTGGSYLDFNSNGAGASEMIILANGNVGIGTTNPKSRLMVIGSGSFTGTVSGSILRAQVAITSSGSLRIAGAFSGATVMYGAGLQDCDAVAGKLLWNAATGRFSCGTDNAGSGFFGSGNVVTLTDRRYVNTAGDTMTGGLLIVNGGSALPSIDTGLLLEIAGTASGRIIHAQDSLQSSGTLIVKKNAGTATGTILAVDSKGLVYDATNKRVGIGTAAPSFAFEVLSNASWMANFYRNDSSDGGITVGQRTSSNAGTALFLGYLPSVDLAQIQGWNYGTSTAEDLTLQGEGGSVIIGEKVTPNAKLHVSTQATGISEALRLEGKYGAQGDGPLLRFTNEHGSGTNPTAGQYNLAGILAYDYDNNWGGGLAFQTPPTGVVGGGTLATRMVIAPGGNVGIGAPTPGSRLSVSGSVVIGNNLGAIAADAGLALEVLGTASGTNLFASKSVTGSHLYAAVTFGGAGLTDCDTAGTSKLLWSADTKTFSCGTDQNAQWSGTGALQTAFDRRYVNVSGDTMTGGLLIVSGSSSAVIDAGLLLEIAGTASGRKLHLQDQLTSSGTMNIGLKSNAKGLVIRGGPLQTSNLQEWQNSAGTVVAHVTATGQLMVDGGDGNYLAKPAIKINNTSAVAPVVTWADTASDLGLRFFTAGGTEVVRFQDNGYVVVTDLQWADSTYNFIRADGSLRWYSASQNGNVPEVIGSAADRNIRVRGGMLDSNSAVGVVLDNATSLVTAGAKLVSIRNNDMEKAYFDRLGGLTTTSSGSFPALFLGAGFQTGLRLEVAGTASGTDLFANTSLRSSGTLVVDGNASIDDSTLFVNSSTNRVGIGTITPETALEVVGTISGSILRARTAITSSGSLRIAGAFSGATVMYGAGLQDCDATTGKLLWNAATGRFTCGTDQTGGAASSFGSGNVVTLTDRRFVNTAGDTMTGGLLIVNGGSILPSIDAGLLLEVAGTMSGRIIHAHNALTSSGTIYAAGSITTKGAFSGASLILNGKATVQKDAVAPSFTFLNDTDTGMGSSNDGGLNFWTNNISMLVLDANGVQVNTSAGIGIQNGPNGSAAAPSFIWQADTDTGFFHAADILGMSTAGREALRVYSNGNVGIGDVAAPGSKLSVSGSVVIGNNLGTKSADAGIALEVLGTASGTNLFASKSVSGSHLYASVTFGGAGLTDCDTAGTSKLLWSADTKQFSCGTDQNAQWSGTGALQTAFDRRYVNVSGDTMTGGLLIQNGNPAGTIDAGLLLEIAGTASGRIIHAQDQLRSSGSLIVTGGATIDGTTFVLNSSTNQVTISGDTDNFAVGPLIVKAVADGTSIGTALTLDSTVETGGKKFSFISTGPTAAAGAGAFSVYNGTDDRYIFLVDANGQYVSGVNQYTPLGQITVHPNSVTTKGIVIRGGASQVANLQEWQNSIGAVLASIDKTGSGYFSRALGVGTSTPGSKLSVSGAMIINPLGTLGNGRADVNVSLEVIGTASGTDLFASKSVSGSHLYASVTFGGAGLTDCDTAGTSKLLWSADTKTFSCGSDQGAGGLSTSTGSLQTAFDRRYVNVSGDTMTGGLLIQSGNPAGTIDAGLLLEIAGTASGRTIRAIDMLASSGALMVKAPGKLAALVALGSTSRVGVGGVTSPGSALSISGAVIISPTGTLTTQSADAGLALEIIGTGSGHTLIATSQLRSSGSLAVENGGAFDTTTLVVDAANNRVGIGTASPSVALHLLDAMRIEDEGDNTHVVQMNPVTGFFTTFPRTLFQGGNATNDTNWYMRFADFYSSAGTEIPAGIQLSTNNDPDYVNSDNLLIISGTTRADIFTTTEGDSDGRGLALHTDNTGSSYTTPNLFLDTVANGNRVGIRTTAPKTTLEVIGTASGSEIHATSQLRSSGSLTVAGLSILNGTTILGDATTDIIRFHAQLSGSLIPNVTNLYDIGSNTLRYRHLYLSGSSLHVGTSGNEATIGYNTGGSYLDFNSNGAGASEMIILANGNVGIGTTNPKSRLMVIGSGSFTGTVSGSILRAQVAITSSGSLRIAGAFSGATTIYGAGLADCDATTGKLLWNAATGRFTCGTDQTGGGAAGIQDHYVRAGGDTMTGGLLIESRASGTTPGTIDAGLLLEVAGAMSGRVIHAHNALTSSGSLRIAGAFTGATTMYGAGLSDCDDATNSKLLWDSTTGRFSCGADQGGSAGITQASGDLRYVNAAGDYMTGALLIKNGNTGGTSADTGILLEVAGTMSGRLIHAMNGLTSSGTLIVHRHAGSATGKLLVVDHEGLIYDGTTRRVGIGTSTPKQVLSLTTSGSDTAVFFQTRNTQVLGTTTATSATNPGTAANDTGVGTVAWTNPSNALTSNDSRATASVASSEVTNYLKLTNFGFSIPAGSQILGIVVRYEKAEPNLAGLVDNRVRIVKGDTIGSTDLSSVDTWPNSDAFVSYGSSSNLWGETWTAADINLSTFGTAISATCSSCFSTADARVDSADITVYYAPLTVKEQWWTMGADRSDSGVFKLSNSGALGNRDFLTVTGSGTFGIDESTSVIRAANIPAGSLVIGSGALCVDNGGSNCDDAARAGGSIYAESTIVTEIDVAENYPTVDDVLGAGDVVELDPTHGVFVRRGTAGTGTLLGIVSTSPGILLGGFNPEQFSSYRQVPVALSGRVPVKVTASGGNIRIGDMLTASDVPGVARLAQPGEQTVGYALQPHTGTGSDGLIQVFVNVIKVDAPGLEIVSALHIDSETSSGSTTLFSITSDVNHDENTVFRVTATGSVYADGAYYTTGADYAEWFRVAKSSSGGTMQPGELVCIDVAEENAIRRCDRPADDNLMGIISTHPAYIGNHIPGADTSGKGMEGYALVGLIGQVPALVTDEGGQIRAGDELTAASKPGYARRAAPGEPTVGVAMEYLDSGEGVVNVLISRRNSSVTVETVEAEILKSIANMEIEDEVNIMVQHAIDILDLNEDISTEVTAQLEENPLLLEIQASLLAMTTDSGSLLGSGLQFFESLGVAADANFGGNLTLSGSVTAAGDLNAASLTTAGNATLGGDARIAGDLYVDGAIKIDELFVPGMLKVDGGMDVTGTLNAGRIAVGSGSTFVGSILMEGDLTMGSGSSIVFASGSTLNLSDLLIRGSLRVIGPVTIESLATFLGDVDVRGALIVSGRQAGYASIAKGADSVTVKFQTGFVLTPVVTASPDTPVLYAVSRATGSGFTISLAANAEKQIGFSWLALVTAAPGETEGLAGIPVYIDTAGLPILDTFEANACLRNVLPLGEDGRPAINCDRYHDDYDWFLDSLGIRLRVNPSLTPSLQPAPDGYVYVVNEDWTFEAPAAASSDSSSSESSSSESSESSSESSSVTSESSVSSSSSSDTSSSETTASESASSESSSEVSESSSGDTGEQAAEEVPPEEPTGGGESATEASGGAETPVATEGQGE